MIGECGETSGDYKYGGQFDHSIETIGIDSMKSHVLVSFNNSRRFIVIFFFFFGGNLSVLFIVGPCRKLVVVDAKLESFLLMNFYAL